MILRSLGAEALARLMTAGEDRAPDLSWLLFGPNNPAIVEGGSADELPLAAE